MRTKFVGLIACTAAVLSIGAANADTFDVLGTFTNGASLTGTIDIDDGELLAVDLNANGVIPGDGATFWDGTATCLQLSCAPGLTSYSYLVPPYILTVSETYNSSTLTYDFHFNGSDQLAYLDLDFTLDPSNAFGTITSGEVYDPACIPGEDGCPVEAGGVYLSGGSLLNASPLPGTLPLFATSISLIWLLGWRRKWKNYHRLSGVPLH